MKKHTWFILSMLIFLAACEKDKPEAIIQNPAEIRIEFSQLLEDYYDGAMALDPLTATSQKRRLFVRGKRLDLSPSPAGASQTPR